MLKTAGYLVYSLGSFSYFALVKALSPFHKRAKELWAGQANLLEHIAENEGIHNHPVIWFHVASLGEFEQGRPVMEALRKQYPDYRIVTTFFSPSGYSLKKNDKISDAVYFLPFESRKHAVELLNILKPKMAFWVKYDFWYSYLRELKERSIPTFLLAAQFRPGQIFFKPYGTFKRDILKQFTFIFCQNTESSNLLHQFGINQHMVSGDNRFDRVYQTMLHQEDVPHVAEFLNGNFTLIAGSSYEKEEEMLAYALNQLPHGIKVIIAPHFVHSERIAAIEKRFGHKLQKYSDIRNAGDIENKQVLLIDSIGLLSRLYHYGHAAFIGGGFWENGLHNSLEAAAFGMPIAFGPKLRRFPEARELVQRGIGTTIENKEEFSEWLNRQINYPEQTREIAAKSRHFVAESKGATEAVMNKVSETLSH